jgi:hypothetical protein
VVMPVGPNLKGKTSLKRKRKRSAERAHPSMLPAKPVDSRVPSGERHGRKARATFHISVELLDELRDVVVALSGPPDRLTLTDFAESALRREVERLRRVHLSGKAFARRTEPIRRGRPIK